MLDVCEEWSMDKTKHKYLHKAAEERYLGPGEMVYLDTSSQKKPSYGGYNNWMLIQYSDTKKNGFYSQR